MRMRSPRGAPGPVTVVRAPVAKSTRTTWPVASRRNCTLPRPGLAVLAAGPSEKPYAGRRPASRSTTRLAATSTTSVSSARNGSREEETSTLPGSDFRPDPHAPAAGGRVASRRASPRRGRRPEASSPAERSRSAERRDSPTTTRPSDRNDAATWSPESARVASRAPVEPSRRWSAVVEGDDPLAFGVREHGTPGAEGEVEGGRDREDARRRAGRRPRGPRHASRLAAGRCRCSRSTDTARPGRRRDRRSEWPPVASPA